MSGLHNKVERIIQEELDRAGVIVSWNMDEIHVHPESEIVIERLSSKGSLSHGLIAHFLPKATAGAKFSHFTTLSAFREILGTNELRLSSLLKRFDEHEFRSFSDDFGLSGYLDKSNGEPYCKTLMANLFYTSFTAPEPHNSNYMWRHFGDQGIGVKITFEISPIELRSELRPVRYNSKNDAAKSLIFSIMGRIKAECGRHFVMRGISRIGAFYLPLGYSLEKEEETRLLVKFSSSGSAHELVSGSGENAYLPLALGVGANDFCALSIVGVQAGIHSDKTEVKQLIMTSSFAGAQLSYI